MDSNELYSIRMHASRDGSHLSGAERIVSAEKIDSTIRELVSRSRNKTMKPDQVTVHIDSLKGAIPLHFKALDVVTLNAMDSHTARSAAERLLRSIGVSTRAINYAIQAIANGAAPSGGNMRGAMVIDAASGVRLEPDWERGVRASRFDWSDDTREAAERMLSDNGLTHFRTREALALATKVVHANGVIAELCWSDDPDYTAGYVASLHSGYVRFPALKQPGDGKGGRAIFIDNGSLEIGSLLRYLHEEVVLISGIGTCRGSLPVEDFFGQLDMLPSHQHNIG